MKDVMKPSVYGVGYVGEGRHTPFRNGRKTREYDVWCGMIRRCYVSPDKRKSQRNLSYIGVTVCDEWHNFQNFAEWYTAQPNYQLSEYQLDKDLLSSGNKVYSPSTCVVVHASINNVLCRPINNRSKFPIGVDVRGGRFRAKARFSGNEQTHLGYFSTPEDAHEAYRLAKTKFVRKTADLYKDSLDPRVYKVLSEYEEPLDRGRHNIEIGIC